MEAAINCHPAPPTIKRLGVKFNLGDFAGIFGYAARPMHETVATAIEVLHDPSVFVD